MPVPNQKSTTSNTNPGAVEQASAPLPEQQRFYEHLRALTRRAPRRAVRVVIEEVMREELTQFLEAS